LMISSAESDFLNCWDLRTDLTKPSIQLTAAFGASQSKAAPHHQNFLLTTHGSETRLWDLRHTSNPIMQFCAHDSRVLCLDWHPHCQMPNSFFTSANDSTLKLWNMSNQQNSASIISIAQFSAWRLVFSFEGEELAALALPPVSALALYSNYGLENPRLLRGIERDTLMDAAWLKSTTALKSTTKFLYTLSNVKHKLCRHAIAYEFSNELRDEMSTPILQKMMKKVIAL
jgi:WD40 repeat protein